MTWSARERAYDGLRALLAAGERLPGDSLSISDLARRWAISETPVREMLWRAAGEGLVIAEPCGGFRIFEPSIEEFRDLYVALERLLVVAIDLLNPSATLCGQYNRCKDDFSSLLNVIGRASDSPSLAGLIANLLARLAPFQRAERSLMPEYEDEVLALHSVLAAGSLAQKREAVRRAGRRRRMLAPATLGLIAEWRRAVRSMDISPDLPRRQGR